MRRGNREILLVRESTRSVCVDRKFSERKVLVRQYRFGYNVWFFIVKLAISIRHLSIVTFNNSAGDSEFLKNNEFDVRVYIYIYFARYFPHLFSCRYHFFICNFNENMVAKYNEPLSFDL